MAQPRVTKISSGEFTVNPNSKIFQAAETGEDFLIEANDSQLTLSDGTVIEANQELVINSIDYPGGLQGISVVQVEPTSFTLTFVFSGDIDPADEPIIANVDGIDLVDNKIEVPAGETFNATSIVVDGYSCEPDTVSILMDSDKTVEIVLTSSGVSLLSGMVTFLDILNGLHVNDTIQKSTDEVWDAEDGNEARVRTKYKCSYGARIAIEITANTNIQMTLGSYDIFAADTGLNIIGNSVTNKDGGDVFTPAPAIGDSIILERLNGDGKVYKTSNGGVTLIEMTSATPVYTQYVDWVGFIINSGSELAKPQINANYVIATS